MNLTFIECITIYLCYFHATGGVGQFTETEGARGIIVNGKQMCILSIPSEISL